MNTKYETLHEMKHYLILWATQLLSGLGSAMTAYALVIWSYTQEGSALKTALLMVCSYTPYVLLSLFAGALSERWNKKRTLLVCDALCALSTLAVLYLLRNGSLRVWHLYMINAFSGLMNTVQQPASELATTALLPKKHYQRVGSLRYFSNSVSSILTPIIATAVLGLWGMDAVIALTSAASCWPLRCCFSLCPSRRTEKKAPKAKSCCALSVRGLSGCGRTGAYCGLSSFLPV